MFNDVVSFNLWFPLAVQPFTEGISAKAYGEVVSIRHSTVAQYAERAAYGSNEVSADIAPILSESGSLRIRAKAGPGFVGSLPYRTVAELG